MSGVIPTYYYPASLSNCHHPDNKSNNVTIWKNYAFNPKKWKITRHTGDHDPDLRAITKVGDNDGTFLIGDHRKIHSMKIKINQTYGRTERRLPDGRYQNTNMIIGIATREKWWRTKNFYGYTSRGYTWIRKDEEVDKWERENLTLAAGYIEGDIVTTMYNSKAATLTFSVNNETRCIIENILSLEKYRFAVYCYHSDDSFTILSLSYSVPKPTCKSSITQVSKQVSKQESKRVKVPKASSSTPTFDLKPTQNKDANSMRCELELRNKQNVSVLLTILIAFCSTISSIALTKSFGYDAQTNGIIAVVMSVLTFIIAVIKLILCLISTARFEGVVDAEIVETLVSKSWILLVVTTCDAVFDCLQGVAAIKGEKYSNSAIFVLVMATWIGVSDEIIESVIEIFVLQIVDHPRCSTRIGLCLMLWCTVECAMSIYLLLKCNNIALKIGGIVAECCLITVCVCMIVFYCASGASNTNRYSKVRNK